MTTVGAGLLPPEQIQSEVMTVADTYCMLVFQALSELQAARNPRIAEWALATKISTATAVYTNAASPNPVVGLLDSVVFASLKRSAIEEHWIPQLLGDEGAKVLAAFGAGEREVWQVAERVLTAQQCQELRHQIDQWKADHPGQYYVGNIRFTEFASDRRVMPQSPQARSGSLFSLLYVDPLAGLDPVGREMRSYRELTERLIYLAQRMPTIYAFQAELALRRATATPQIERFVDSTQQFAGATTQVSDSVKQFTQDFPAERAALIKQMDEALGREVALALENMAQRVATEREATLLQSARILSEERDKWVQGLTSAAGASSREVTAAAEASSIRVIDHAFRRILMLVAILLVGIPAVLVLLMLARRMLRPAGGVTLPPMRSRAPGSWE
jgi:hypothetical protein